MNWRREDAIQSIKGLKRDGASLQLMTFRPEAGTLALPRNTQHSPALRVC